MKRNRNLVLIMGSLMQLFLGIIYIWSIFVQPVHEKYGWSIDETKLTSSFMLSFFVVGVLIGGKLQNIISTQKTVLAGGLALTAAMGLTAIIPDDMGLPVFLLYFTYGILGGIGVGMGYNSIITTAQKNFPDKRGLATGISVCALGLSTVIFVPLITELQKSIGLQNTFFALGGAVLVVTLVCSPFITMPQADSVANATVANTAITNDVKTKDMLKTKTFYFIAISMMLGTVAYFVLNPSFITLGQEKGLEPNVISIMIMFTGICNAMGRLFFPMISDKTGRSLSAALAITFTAVGSISLVFVDGILFIIAVNLIAFCYGGFAGIYPVVTGKHFGLKYVGTNYGCVLVGFSLASLFGPMLLGFIEDQTFKFVITTIIALVGLACAIPLIIKERKEG